MGEKSNNNTLGLCSHFDRFFSEIVMLCNDLPNNLPRDIKSSKSVSEFKTKIKNFGNIDCECVICR